MKAKLMMALMIFFCINQINAQKVLDEDYSFKYKRLPTNPIEKSIKNYKAQVVLAYEEESKQKAAEYNKQVKDNEAQYQKEKQEYKDQAFGKKFVDKVVLEESGPSKSTIEKPYIHKIVDKNILASTYIKLNGYEKLSSSNLIVTFTAHGIEWLETKIAESSYTVAAGAEAGKVKKQYNGVIQYRSPISIKVETADGNVILDEIVEKTNEYRTWESQKFDIKSDAEKKTDPYVILPQYEQKVIEDNMKIANELLNSKCATSFIERKTIVYSVETKKMDYSDFQQAYLSAVEGYTMLADNSDAAKTSLQSAIAAWSKALKESNVADKKARVNKEITIATLFNLAEAYIWTNDFSNAKLMLAKAAPLDLSRKENNKVDELKKIIEDQKIRFEANN